MDLLYAVTFWQVMRLLRQIFSDHAGWKTAAMVIAEQTDQKCKCLVKVVLYFIVSYKRPFV